MSDGPWRSLLLSAVYAPPESADDEQHHAERASGATPTALRNTEVLEAFEAYKREQKGLLAEFLYQSQQRSYELEEKLEQHIRTSSNHHQMLRKMWTLQHA